MDGVAALALPVVVVALVGGGLLAWHHRRSRALLEGLHRLATRDRLEVTSRPCGLDRRQYEGRFEATPSGDRRCGLRYAVQGPVDVDLDGREVRAELACFEWWYEVRVRSDRSTSYQRRTSTVAVVRLPVVVPGVVRVRPEGVLGRVGLRRSDQQLESEEFNRRFHVTGSDPQLTVRFLDAAMQHRLLATATDRNVHLEGDLLVLGGSPSHRDGSLPGVIGELPAVAQDLTGLLRAVPGQVWRLATPVGGSVGTDLPPPPGGRTAR